MLVKINNGFRKRKGFGLMDLALYAIALSILVAAGVMAYNDYQDGNKRAVAKEEMKTLATAASLYIASAKTGTAPTDLGQLVVGLTADQSNDNVIKAAFVAKPTWTTVATTFVDPWGTAYTYTAATKTISCANNGGTAFTINF